MGNCSAKCVNYFKMIVELTEKVEKLTMYINELETKLESISQKKE